MARVPRGIVIRIQLRVTAVAARSSVPVEDDHDPVGHGSHGPILSATLVINQTGWVADDGSLGVTPGSGRSWRGDGLADRSSIRRQFKLILEALSEGKKEGQDWRLVTNDAGEPEGIRIMYRASWPGDDPKSH